MNWDKCEKMLYVIRNTRPMRINSNKRIPPNMHYIGKGNNMSYKEVCYWYSQAVKLREQRGWYQKSKYGW